MSYLFEPIILASASPRRAELLRDAFIPFEVCPSHAEEIKNSDCTAAFLVKKNALLKAMDVAKQYPSRLVLGADTIVYRKGKLYGKPMNRHDAERMLEELQGKMHQVITGVALLCLDEGVKRVFDVVTDVAFNMTDPATQADYDFNTQAGWGPDYLDPSTFTDVFSVSRNGAFMPNIGMLTEGKTSAEVAKINEIAEQIGLTEYDRLNDEARAIVDDLDARYEAFAKVDAYLLANGLYLPVSMQTRGLKVTKVVPFTKPYALGGTGQYKLKFMKVQNDMVTKAQWEEAQAAWIEKVG